MFRMKALEHTKKWNIKPAFVPTFCRVRLGSLAQLILRVFELQSQTRQIHSMLGEKL